MCSLFGNKTNNADPQMNDKMLHNENRQFHGTAGVSENCRATGFQPAFRDQHSGRVELSRQKNGEPATMHLISWLPHEWAESTGDCGAVLTLKPGIVSGFVKDGTFYTREETACMGTGRDVAASPPHK